MDKLKDKPKLLSTKNIMYFFNFSLILFFIAYGIITGISGNDFWWHAKIGEWICENKQIPTTGIFGWWTELNNYSWVSHEWLSEIIFFKPIYSNEINRKKMGRELCVWIIMVFI